MTSSRLRFAAVSSLLAFVVVLSGCALSHNMGMRPSEPTIQIDASACAEYKSYADYAQKLQEAYHSRATQNRGWIYVAGILGLGVAAASGGLAVASTVGAGTLGLLAISGGFAGGSFATINNEALALSYTVAANSVDEALKSARGQLAFVDPNDKTKGYTGASCAAALPILIVGVSNARTHLEVARTDNAAGALARAKDQLTLLNKQITAVQEEDLTQITLAPEITGLTTNPAPVVRTTDTVVTLTVHAKLGGVGVGDLKVVLDAKAPLPVDAIAQPDITDPYTYAVKFSVPKGTDKGVYAPELVIKGKTRVKSKSSVKLDYP